MKFEKRENGTYLLDVTGYVCPQPQMYTKKALQRIGAGEVLEVCFDNASSGESIRAMIAQSGDEVLQESKQGGNFILTIKKA